MQQHVTELLTRAANGDAVAAQAVLPEVYEALHALAQRYMAAESRGHTLQATALVNEAYLKLVGEQPRDWNGREHFFAAAAQAMRRILVDHARRGSRQKRGGNLQRVSLEYAEAGDGVSQVDYIALDDALDRLEAEDPRAARVVMLKHFAGMTDAETAATMGVSERTVRREWSCARLWLYEQLGGSAEDER